MLASCSVKLLIVKVRVIEAIQEKVQQIRHHRFHTLLLQITYNIIVGAGMELDKNFANHAHTGFAAIMKG
ncbi:hypothetical protein D3C76_1753510 [compost metagenome]